MRPSEKKCLNGLIRLDNPEGRSGLLRLDKNERLGPLSRAFVKRFRSVIDSDILSVYPEVEVARAACARYAGVRPDRIFLGHGSDAVIKQAFDVFAYPGKGVLMPDPTYAMYEVYARMAGTEICKVRYNLDLNIDKEEFIKKITSGISIVCLANPDSPTGASYDRGFILRCLKKCINTGAVLLIDEAYYHFSKDTVIKDIMTKDNLIVTRTFSKAFGLAGCRAGFMAASKNLTAGLKKARPMYEMNALSAMLAKLCADAPDEAERYARQIDGSREYVISACSKMGIRCVPSRTNFMNMTFPAGLDVSAFEVFAGKRGCLLKSYRDHGCFKNNVRITLGPKPYMARFLGILKEFISEV